MAKRQIAKERYRKACRVLRILNKNEEPNYPESAKRIPFWIEALKSDPNTAQDGYYWIDSERLTKWFWRRNDLIRRNVWVR